MSSVSTDPIADMLTRIRNAAKAGKHEVRLPYSIIKEKIARELAASKFLAKVEVEKASPRDVLVITINEVGSNPRFTEITRMSTPGRRLYAGIKDIPRIKSGRGIVILSTSKGVMSSKEAIKQRLGGELICKVY